MPAGGHPGRNRGTAAVGLEQVAESRRRSCCLPRASLRASQPASCLSAKPKTKTVVWGDCVTDCLTALCTQLVGHRKAPGQQGTVVGWYLNELADGQSDARDAPAAPGGGSPREVSGLNARCWREGTSGLRMWRGSSSRQVM